MIQNSKNFVFLNYILKYQYDKNISSIHKFPDFKVGNFGHKIHLQFDIITLEYQKFFKNGTMTL